MSEITYEQPTHPPDEKRLQDLVDIVREVEKLLIMVATELANHYGARLESEPQALLDFKGAYLKVNDRMIFTPKFRITKELP